MLKRDGAGKHEKNGSGDGEIRVRRNYSEDCEGAAPDKRGKEGCRAPLAVLRDWRLLLLRGHK